MAGEKSQVKAHLYKGWLKAKRCASGLVNFVPSDADHFCLNFPEKIWQPCAHFLAQPSFELPSGKCKTDTWVDAENNYGKNDTRG